MRGGGSTHPVALPANVRASQRTIITLAAQEGEGVGAIPMGTNCVLHLLCDLIIGK